ncbi:hypothetical protein RHGRI_026792 [Rhododendron griersonianum]|uniref:Uncharacterized protein n=1 Tax=Rhododendron griersonianum TaxID=479676 RepID=A0AAV6IU45_9ERIC|nr:hypothetical protein RHGRI_026792 [Rhododendron griersonianum]
MHQNQPPPENKQGIIDDRIGVAAERELREISGGREPDRAAEEDPRDEAGGEQLRAPGPLDGVGEEMLRRERRVRLRADGVVADLDDGREAVFGSGCDLGGCSERARGGGGGWVSNAGGD